MGVPSSEYCNAEGDVFPVCSLKRWIQTDAIPSIPNAEVSGRAIRELSNFTDFSRWYFEDSSTDYVSDDYAGNLGSVSKLVSVMTFSYDPIWLMFHSFIVYQQNIWTDCNDYDLIDPEDLDEHPEAYTAFCDEDACSTVGQQLDDAFDYPL